MPLVKQFVQGEISELQHESNIKPMVLNTPLSPIELANQTATELETEHLNILNEGNNDQIENIVYNLVNELNGSISAEHGIGIMKKKYLHQYDSKNQIQLLKDIKKTFDPNNILNPGLII